MTKPLKKTDNYKRWKRILESAMTFPVEQHMESIRELNESRTSRGLHTSGRISAARLMNATATDTSVRSRVVELMVQAKRNNYAITSANEAMINYILAERFATGATVAERNNSAKHFIAKGTDFEGELDLFIEICGDIIADIDAAGWSLRRMIEAIQIVSKPENTF